MIGLEMYIAREIDTYYEDLAELRRSGRQAIPGGRSGKVVPGGPQYEPVRHILNDRQRIATTQASTLTFFKTPYGQTQDGAVKTLFDTNLSTAGQLSSTQRFSAYGLAISYQSNSSPGDLRLILNSAWFELTIGPRKYAGGPLKQYPSAEGLYGYAGNVSAPGEASTSGIPSVNEWFALALGSRPIDIPPQQSFYAEIGFKTTLALALATDCWVKLLGVLYKEI